MSTQQVKLKAIADAIRAKDGTTAPIIANDFADRIIAIPSREVEHKDVNFYDYRGSLVASYTIAEAQVLTVLPNAPTFERLTFQSWNHTLAEVNATTRPLNVGATYTTTSGKYEMVVEITENNQVVTLPAWAETVDWGNGHVQSDVTTQPSYTYPIKGRYIVSLVGSVVQKTTSTINYGYDAIVEVNVCDVTSIGNDAFYLCPSLQSVTISQGVTSIGNNAFYSCTSLQSVTIPQGVTSIGNGVFNFCPSLQSVTIPQSVTSIGNSTFNYCALLQSVTIPHGVTSIGNNAFYYCTSLQSVTIPQSVTNIGTAAFYVCPSLQSVTIPQSVTNIGTNAFYSCATLQSVTIPQGVTSIGNGVFNSCTALQSVTIPQGVVSIGTGAFYLCTSLQSVTISQSVTSIGTNAFYYCTALQSVTIPQGVVSIGDRAFYDCRTLRSTIILRTEDVVVLDNANAFSPAPNKFIYVPDALVDDYKVATNWSTLAQYIKPLSDIGL